MYERKNKPGMKQRKGDLLRPTEMQFSMTKMRCDADLKRTRAHLANRCITHFITLNVVWHRIRTANDTLKM